MAIETNLGDVWPIGSDGRFDVYCVDQDGAVLDISAFTLQFVLKVGERDTTAIISKATASGITVVTRTINGVTYTNAVARVTTLAADAPNMSAGKYEWALWRTNSGDVRPIAWGTLGAFVAATRV